MTISVVIAAYNEEKYLPKTLESLKNLERKPDEVIVVDSNSTDKTAEIARDHGAWVLETEKRGIGFARDKGLIASKGDIIAFTDADTVVPKDWLTKIEETLGGPGVVGVFGTYRVPDGWWVYKYYVNYAQPFLNKIYFLFGIPMAPGQNMAFLRKVGIAAGGFPEDFKIGEDIEMAKRLMKKGKVISRDDLVVKSSGRRGDEGNKMITRVFKFMYYYVFFKKGNIVGFPDMR
jgi:glycosyltransferase involved in cell wall biosynthesis